MEKYNQAWFKERAFKSLKKIGEGIWDFSDSLLIYIGSGDTIYESLQEEDTSYFKLVTKPEREYLQSIAKNIADMLPNGFEYIDLGPGTEHKEQFLFDELKKQNKSFTYIPVDISDHFLRVAESHAAKQGIPVRSMKTSFEELPETLGKEIIPRFVSLLGLTFSNYAPQEILELLTKIAGANGYILIDTHMRDRINMVELQNVYQQAATLFVGNKTKLLGLNTPTDISSITIDDGFRAWCSVINSNSKLKRLGVKSGDRIMLAQSLRYTKDSLESELKNFNYVSFDTGSPFIGTIIKT